MVRRRRLGGAAVALTVASAATFLLPRDGGVSTDTLGPPPTYEQHALAEAPLFDGPTPEIPLTQVIVDGPASLSFESSAEGVVLTFEHADTVPPVIARAEAQPSRAIIDGGLTQAEPGVRSDWAYRFGVTRSEVVRVEVVPMTGDPISVATLGHGSIPGLRFFVMEDPFLRDGSGVLVRLRGYGRDGQLLTDGCSGPRGIIDCGGLAAAGTATVALSEIPEGVSAAELEGRSVFLVRRGDDVRAFSPDARHMKGEVVSWCPEARVFVEMAHASLFDVEGRKIAGPGVGGLNEFYAELDGDQLVVDLGRLTVGMLEPRGERPAGLDMTRSTEDLCGDAVEPLSTARSE